MNLTNLPTDNLYKFCALAGVTVGILSIYLPHSFIWQIDERTTKFRLENKVADIEVQYLNHKIGRLEKEMDSLNKMVEEIKKHKLREGKTSADVDIALEKLKNATAAIAEAMKQREIKNAELKILGEAIDELLARGRLLNKMSLATGILGWALAIYGFRAWYRNVQVHQDAIIKMQAEKKDESPKR